MPVSMSTERTFGPYLVWRQSDDHAVIRRQDGGPVEPTFYEMQHMKNMAFGGTAWAVEVFPPHRHLVDGEHQRHLWQVARGTVPDLSEGDPADD